MITNREIIMSTCKTDLWHNVLVLLGYWTALTAAVTMATTVRLVLLQSQRVERIVGAGARTHRDDVAIERASLHATMRLLQLPVKVLSRQQQQID